jgi:DNA-binding NarL/FixJ family response regulator
MGTSDATRVMTDGDRSGTTRVLVVSRAGVDLAELIRSLVVDVEVMPLPRVLHAGSVDADLVVLHTHAPVRELTALSTLAQPVPPVLVVASALPAAEVVPALRAGARSLLVEGQFTRTDLLDAVRSTARGQSRLSPDVLSTVVVHVQGQHTDRGEPVEHQPLSRREHEIMELVAAGEPNAAIAAHLRLAEKTVRNRVSQIYLKLKVRNRTEAIIYWRGDRR